MKKSLEDHLGDIIQKARQGLGISAEFLIQNLDLTAAQLSALEAYQWIPDQEVIDLIASYLELDPHKLKQHAKVIELPAPTVINTDGIIACVLYGETNEANCYIAEIKQANAVIIVDPGIQYDRICNIISKIGVQPTAVLLTHEHYDHTRSLHLISDMYQCPVFPYSISKEQLLHRIPQLEIWDTPGHTNDSRCYLLPEIVFVGDLLFAGSVGRAACSHWQKHLNSVQRILALPETTTICPGHGPVTAVTVERKINPFVRDVNG